VKHVGYVVVISTLTMALSGAALAQSGAAPYPSVLYQSTAPAMPGNGQLQGRSPGRTPQQSYSVPVPPPGQDQSHFSPDPRSPQLGPPLKGYDAPARRFEPDHTELESCFSAAARRLKETVSVTKLMAACSIEVDQWMDQCVQGGTSASSCTSLWGSFATEAQKAAQSGYRRSVDREIENAR
jgi:hypothetical protein